MQDIQHNQSLLCSDSCSVKDSDEKAIFELRANINENESFVFHHDPVFDNSLIEYMTFILCLKTANVVSFRMITLTINDDLEQNEDYLKLLFSWPPSTCNTARCRCHLPTNTSVQTRKQKPSISSLSFHALASLSCHSHGCCHSSFYKLGGGVSFTTTATLIFNNIDSETTVVGILGHVDYSK